MMIQGLQRLFVIPSPSKSRSRGLQALRHRLLDHQGEFRRILLRLLPLALDSRSPRSYGAGRTALLVLKSARRRYESYWRDHRAAASLRDSDSRKWRSNFLPCARIERVGAQRHRVGHAYPASCFSHMHRNTYDASQAEKMYDDARQVNSLRELTDTGRQ